MNPLELPPVSFWRSPRPSNAGVLYDSRREAVQNCEQVCEPLYTADQMLAYGEECARMERERCAKVADQYATSGGWTGRYFDGYVDAAKAIASALRDGWNAGDDYRDAIRKDPE